MLVIWTPCFQTVGSSSRMTVAALSNIQILATGIEDRSRCSRRVLALSVLSQNSTGTLWVAIKSRLYVTNIRYGLSSIWAQEGNKFGTLLPETPYDSFSSSEPRGKVLLRNSQKIEKWKFRACEEVRWLSKFGDHRYSAPWTGYVLGSRSIFRITWKLRRPRKSPKPVIFLYIPGSYMTGTKLQQMATNSFSKIKFSAVTLAHFFILFVLVWTRGSCSLT